MGKNSVLFLLNIVKNDLKSNLNNVMVGNVRHFYHRKQEEVLLINSEVRKLLKKGLFVRAPQDGQRCFFNTFGRLIFGETNFRGHFFSKFL